MHKPSQVVFPVLGERCQDCELRDNPEGGTALNEVGEVVRSKTYGYSMAHGCAGCRGTGREIMGEIDATHLLSRLTDRQRFVVELRNGLRDGRRYTLSQVAEMMGVKHQTVAEHEKAAIDRMYELLTGKKRNHPATTTLKSPSR